MGILRTLQLAEHQNLSLSNFRLLLYKLQRIGSEIGQYGNFGGYCKRHYIMGDSEQNAEIRSQLQGAPEQWKEYLISLESLAHVGVLAFPSALAVR